MRMMIVIFVLFTSSTAKADDFVIATERRSISVSVTMDKKADYVAVPIFVRSNGKGLKEPFVALHAAIESIRAAFATHSDIQVVTRTISLSARDGRGYRSKGSGLGPIRVRLLVLGRLSDGADLFSQVTKIHQILSRVEPPEKVSFRTGISKLGLQRPESYRDQLLKMIRDQIAATRKSLGASGKVAVRGLEGPVRAMEKNESEVMLFINYAIVLTI